MAKVKICGLFRDEDIAAANRVLPDYIGFVFAAKSPRRVSFEKAKALKQLLDERIAAVGVFVNESVEAIAAALSSGIIDIAQLHGDEDAHFIEELKRRAGKPVIKAFMLDAMAAAGENATEKRDAALRALAEAETSPADFVLLDSGRGSGAAFDWQQVKGFSRPYFLAGGLNPENIAKALEELSPFAVDASSGVETAGFKDEAKMRLFVQRARGSAR